MADRSLARDWKFWVVTAFGALCLLMTVINIVLNSHARERRAEVTGRQQFINESQGLSRLHSQLIQALATLSTQSNDEAIRAVLAKYGVTFRKNDSPATPDPAHKAAP